jgi:hypothetical protein
MASIGLTVAAGSYIVNQIAGIERPQLAAPAVTGPLPAPRLIEPASPDPPGVWGHVRPAAAGDVRPAAVDHVRPAAVDQVEPAAVDLMAQTRELPVAWPAGSPGTSIPAVEHIVPGTPDMPVTTGPAGDNEWLHLLGSTYVGADVTARPPNSYSITVHTNVFTVLGTLLTGRVDEDTPATVGAGQLRTDHGTATGGLTLAVSDPWLGQHGVTLPRNPAPAPVGDRRPVAVPITDAQVSRDAPVPAASARRPAPAVPATDIPPVVTATSAPLLPIQSVAAAIEPPRSQ